MEVYFTFRRKKSIRLPQEEIKFKIFRERKRLFPHLVYSQFPGRGKGNKKEKESMAQRAGRLFEILP